VDEIWRFRFNAAIFVRLVLGEHQRNYRQDDIMVIALAVDLQSGRGRG
jgi:hypothetical protein